VNRPTTMRAMRLAGAGQPLRDEEVALRALAPHEVLVAVKACGVCRTDLHVLEGELPQARYPVIPGHEIVGRIVECGTDVIQWTTGDRVGIPWLASSCGTCTYCRNAQENLCERAQFTGCSIDGGYAQYTIADARYCLSLPATYSDAEAAPLLCAGLIGYRAYRLAGDARNLGLYGFGAAAHLLCQIATSQGRRVFAFTRPGDSVAQEFARRLGAVWAGSSTDTPGEPLDAAILFAPDGKLVPAALAAVRRGGRVVCAGIHMSDIPAFPYSLLWGERSVCSVANLTREDGRGFMALAARLDLRPAVQIYPLADASVALQALAAGKVQGAAVLTTT
jgi:alcohol dehydrogenase, propanol-preferring